MATWVHLSTYLLFVVNLSVFKLFNEEGAFFSMTSVKDADWKFPDKEIHFLFKKRKNEKRNISTLPGRQTKFDAKGLMGNFIG